MSNVQLHLALTHVPVILSLVGLIMLVVAFFIKNITLTKTSYFLILAAGLSAIPVYFSGEGAEEAVENLPGVSETIIEKHEDIAKLAMIIISATGLLALAGLILFKRQGLSRVIRIVLILLALTSGGLMVQTAHLGGQIRHTEVRSGADIQNGNNAVDEDEEKGTQKQEKDND